jgi:starch synthase
MPYLAPARFFIQPVVPMNICFATTECVPFAKTGGLADVSGALPKALAEQGHHVKLFLPLYQATPVFDYGFVQAHELDGITAPVGHRTIPFHTWYGHLPDSEVEVYLIDCPLYFHRPQLYTADRDEDERFILFQHAILNVLQRYAWAPDVIHCNDWATALLPVYLRKTYSWDHLFAQTATLLSIHNIGYQGRFAPASIHTAGLSYDEFYPGGPYELDGAFSFLKAGIFFADVLSTVSPTYAQEIQEPDLGADLDGVLRARSHDLFGVLNGIDTDVWNPATDTYLPHHYEVDDLAGKALNKQALLQQASLPYDPDVPLIGFISRLTAQKGIALLQPILQPMLEQHAVQFIFLGSGEDQYEDFFRWAAQTYPHRVATYIGYNERLAHLIEAGSDMFLMPSRYEPCGLNQMYSLAYGTVPIVRNTGGLADTVRDVYADGENGNGFSFNDYEGYALHDAIERALAVFQDQDAWRVLMQRGMAQDFSWTHSAHAYTALYEHARRKVVGV